MYKGIASIFRRYWEAYGGLRSLCRSPYLHLAVVLLALTFKVWVEPTCQAGGSCVGWWDQSLSTLPNLLGFTLGGFAIFIGFSDEKFRQQLVDPGSDPTAPSDYLQLCATFVHFILVQVFALLFAIVAKAWWFYAEWMEPVRDLLPWMNMAAGAVGYGLFLYAITSVLAATMHVFRIANMYQAHERHKHKQAQAQQRSRCSAND